MIFVSFNLISIKKVRRTTGPVTVVVVVVTAVIDLVAVTVLLGVTVVAGTMKMTASSVTVFEIVVDWVGTGFVDVEASWV